MIGTGDRGAVGGSEWVVGERRGKRRCGGGTDVGLVEEVLVDLVDRRDLHRLDADTVVDDEVN